MLLRERNTGLDLQLFEACYTNFSLVSDQQPLPLTQPTQDGVVVQKIIGVQAPQLEALIVAMLKPPA